MFTALNDVMLLNSWLEWGLGEVQAYPLLIDSNYRDLAGWAAGYYFELGSHNLMHQVSTPFRSKDPFLVNSPYQPANQC